MRTLHKRMALSLLGLSYLFLASCERIDDLIPKGEGGEGNDPISYLYALTNSIDNEVLVYEIAENGELSLTHGYLTQGEGSGTARPGGPGEGADALSAQDPLILSDDDQFLFAVNAGNNTVTSFRVYDHGARLEVADVVASGGVFPVSVSVHDNILYVVNEGANGNIDFRDDIAGDEPGSIQGYRVNKQGKLIPIPGSNVALDYALTNRGTIDFSPDGQVLAITEIRADQVAHFLIDEAGKPEGPYVYELPGDRPLGPFGAQFDNNGFFHASVVNEIGPIESPSPSGEVVTFRFDGEGGTYIVGRVPTNGSAACWFEPTSDFRYGYVTNTITDDISGYKIGDDGSLTALTDNSIVASTGTRTVPLEITSIPGFLFVLAPGPGAIDMGGELQVFKILDGGLLTRVDITDELPREAGGLAAIGDALP